MLSVFRHCKSCRAKSPRLIEPDSINSKLVIMVFPALAIQFSMFSPAKNN